MQARASCKACKQDQGKRSTVTWRVEGDWMEVRTVLVVKILTYRLIPTCPCTLLNANTSNLPACYDLLEDNNAKETKEKTSCSRVNNINMPNLSRDRLTTQICPSRVAPNPNPNNMTTCCLLLAHLSEYTKVLLVLYLYQSR